jgi:hypothetical protein
MIYAGGGFQFVEFRKLLSRTPILNTNLPPTPIALVLDSTPGGLTFDSTTALLAPSDRILRLISIPVFALLYGIFILINLLLGRQDFLQELRDTLNHADLLPAISSTASTMATPRLYIYSKTDRLVGVEYVAQHAQQARAKGYFVEEIKLDKSPHVAHARTDPTRYWNAVSNLWSTAIQHNTSSSAVRLPLN